MTFFAWSRALWRRRWWRRRDFYIRMDPRGAVIAVLAEKQAAQLDRLEAKIDTLPRLSPISMADRIKGAPTAWTAFGDVPATACVTCVELDPRTWDPLVARMERIESKLDALIGKEPR